MFVIKVNWLKAVIKDFYTFFLKQTYKIEIEALNL